MNTEISRRQALLGGVVTGVSVLGIPWSRVAHAARDQLVVRVEQDLRNLDPANRTSAGEANVLLAVMQGLVRFKPASTEWELDAAAEIKQPSDTLIEFTLKPGLKFTGGYGDLTAADVKFSFERFIKPGPDGKKVTYAADWSALDSVEVTGPLSGKIHLKSPAPALWVIALADASGLITSQKAFEALGPKFASTVIGSGPYILKEWVPRDHFLLAANPDYVGPAPHFTQILCKPITEDKTAELAFRAGELQFTRIDPAVAGSIAGVPDSKTIQMNAIDYIWIGPNMAKKPFDDLRVRQALRRAIDVDAILQAAYGGHAPRARALEAPGILGHWADAPKYNRDIAAAKALLKQAGLQDGFKTTLTVLNTAIAQTTAAVVQSNLADIDIELQVNALDPGAYWAYGDKDASAALDLVLVEYKGKFDPGFQTQWFTSDQIGKWNWQRFNSPEFDELTRRAAVTTDTKQRAQMYIEAQKLMDASAAFVWITHNAYSFADRSWLAPSILPNGSQWQFDAFKEV